MYREGYPETMRGNNEFTPARYWSYLRPEIGETSNLK
jgi:hypothetical protein